MKLGNVKEFLKENRYFLKACGAAVIIGCAVNEIYDCGMKNGVKWGAYQLHDLVKSGGLAMKNPETGEEIPYENTKEWLKMW